MERVDAIFTRIILTSNLYPDKNSVIPIQPPGDHDDYHHTASFLHGVRRPPTPCVRPARDRRARGSPGCRRCDVHHDPDLRRRDRPFDRPRPARHGGRNRALARRGRCIGRLRRAGRRANSAAAAGRSSASCRARSLLPRHWEWLATQPGGASVALRKLVEDARRTHAEADRRRDAQARAYHFMSAMAGDLPGFEEAARALATTGTAHRADRRLAGRRARPCARAGTRRTAAVHRRLLTGASDAMTAFDHRGAIAPVATTDRSARDRHDRAGTLLRNGPNRSKETTCCRWPEAAMLHAIARTRLRPAEPLGAQRWAAVHAPEAASQRLNRGAIAPVADEADLVDLRVTGTIPHELAGTLLRNGPNRAAVSKETTCGGRKRMMRSRVRRRRATGYRNAGRARSAGQRAMPEAASQLPDTNPNVNVLQMPASCSRWRSAPFAITAALSIARCAAAG